MNNNKQTYLSDKVVGYYDKYDGLQKPEQAIFDLLKNKLKEMKMLDIGIGGGRTTRYFAPLVKEYIGIDYSEKMINTCKKKFNQHFANATFITSDVRNLSAFSENEFDLILFSFNGIDCISYEERITTLDQIKKLLKKEGYFCFSSHNIKAIDDLLKPKIHLNILYSVKRYFDINKIKRLNKEQLEKSRTGNWIIINDGDHDFGTQYCYIDSLHQVNILRKLGFNNISIFSLNEGNILESENEIRNSKSKWIYYLCS